MKHGFMLHRVLNFDNFRNPKTKKYGIIENIKQLFMGAPAIF